MDTNKIVEDLYNIFLENNTLNDCGDVYFPEAEYKEYLNNKLGA